MIHLQASSDAYNFDDKRQKIYGKEEIPNRIEMTINKNISVEVCHLNDWEGTLTSALVFPEILLED
jgi:hypothetical protein